MAVGGAGGGLRVSRNQVILGWATHIAPRAGRRLSRCTAEESAGSAMSGEQGCVALCLANLGTTFCCERISQYGSSQLTGSP